METTSQSSGSIPKGVEKFFSIVGLIYYALAAFFVFLISATVPYASVIPWYLYFFMAASVVLISIYGHSVIAKKKWILPVSAASLVIGAIYNLYFYFVNPSLINNPVFLISFAFTFLFSAIFTGLVYKYRNFFSGHYFHPVYSTLFILALIASIASLIMNGGILKSPTTLPGMNMLPSKETLVGFTITPALGWGESATTSNPVIITSPDAKLSLLIYVLPISSEVTLDSLTAEGASRGIQFNKSVFSHNYPGLVSGAVANKTASTYTRVLYIAYKGMLYQLFEISYTLAGLDSPDFASMVSSFTLTN